MSRQLSGFRSHRPRCAQGVPCRPSGEGLGKQTCQPREPVGLPRSGRASPPPHAVRTFRSPSPTLRLDSSTSRGKLGMTAPRGRRDFSLCKQLAPFDRGWEWGNILHLEGYVRINYASMERTRALLPSLRQSEPGERQRRLCLFSPSLALSSGNHLLE